MTSCGVMAAGTRTEESCAPCTALRGSGQQVERGAGNAGARKPRKGAPGGGGPTSRPQESEAAGVGPSGDPRPAAGCEGESSGSANRVPASTPAGEGGGAGPRRHCADSSQPFPWQRGPRAPTALQPSGLPRRTPERVGDRTCAPAQPWVTWSCCCPGRPTCWCGDFAASGCSRWALEGEAAGSRARGLLGSEPLSWGSSDVGGTGCRGWRGAQVGR